MIRSHRFALLTGVALPVFLAGPVSGTAEDASTAAPIVVAQADSLAAAQGEVAAAQAALQEAQASGGDVAAAQARLDAALNALAAAQAAAQSHPDSEPSAQPESQQQEAAPSQPKAAPPQPPSQPPSQEAAPKLEAPPAPERASPPPEQPAAGSPPQPPAQLAPPAADQAPPELPAPEQPAPQTQDGEAAPAHESQASPQTSPAPEEVPPQPPAAEAAPLPPDSPLSPAASQEPVPELPAPDQPQPRPSTGEAKPPLERPAPPVKAQPEAPTVEQPTRAAVQPEIQAPPEESAVEAQLEAQGDQEAVDNVRSLREKLRQEFARGEPEADTQNARRGDGDDDRGGRRGDDRDYGDSDRRHRDRPSSDEGDVVLDFGLGFVVEIGDQLVIRRDSASESERFLDRARDVDVEHLRGGYTRTAVTRRDGTRIYTVRDRYGNIITRTRVSPNGRQVVLIDNRDFYRDGRRPHYGRYDRDLPPLRIDIPREQYVVETSRYGRDDIRTALMAPPVEAVEHPYSLEDVRTSQRLRDKLRRVDLNTITFDFGSAAISPSQFEALAVVGNAIEDILARSPNELFLLEGYTDAVGSPTANLILSDQRAEAIAVALSSNFAIPPENLVTQGYGEQYLKVPTQEAERENRRVTVRRITPLVAQTGVTAQ